MCLRAAWAERPSPDSLRSILLGVRKRLVIDAGPTVWLDGEPAQGTRHRILFGLMSDGDRPVVVKIERIPGALERERLALAWVGQTKLGLAPSLISFGEASLDGDQVTCLVTERCRGSAPTTVAGWRRMGGTFARLADIGSPEHSLTVVDPDEFVQAHRERVSGLGSRLDPFVGSIPDWAELSHRILPASTALALTHGDPGPGNYLDTGSSGLLIDWEEAHVAPLGLDLARLIFIALLGSGPAGYIARDHQARAAAAAAGYLHAIEDRWLPTSNELRWWFTVAGIQFIHRRWQLGGPAPWENTAELLVSALTSTTHPWL